MTPKIESRIYHFLRIVAKTLFYQKIAKKEISLYKIKLLVLLRINVSKVFKSFRLLLKIVKQIRLVLLTIIN